MSEVVEHNDAPQSEAPVTSMFQVLERAATNPEVDVEKMERLYQMVEKAQDREAEQAWNAAMVEVQSKVEPIRKSQENKQTSSWYADLASIADQINKVFTEHGFFLMFSEGEQIREGETRVICDIGHKQGHTKQRHADVPITTTGIGGKKMMTDVHGKGSSFTYGRRYLTVLLANIPTPDNDGNAPMNPPPVEMTEELQKLKADLESAADEGWDRLKEAWNNTPEETRMKLPGGILDELKKRVPR